MSNLIHKVIATGFGAGLSPVAPGTAGALVGCFILWGLGEFFPEQFKGGWPEIHWLLLLIAVFLALGVWVSRKLEPEWGRDPNRIVVDEIVGVWVAMLCVPLSFINLALAFVLFRVFDIWKPLGIRKMEDLPGGWGVMMDDVLAGIYACILVHTIGFL